MKLWNDDDDDDDGADFHSASKIQAEATHAQCVLIKQINIKINKTIEMIPVSSVLVKVKGKVQGETQN